MQNGNPKHISQCLPKPFDLAGVQKVLEEPFDPVLVRFRPGNFGNQLAYVEGHEYIKRLNLAFGGKWSFEVIQFEVKDNEALVLGKLTTHGGAVVKMAFGGSKITVNHETGEVISIVDDLKAAATDALKKAASLLGVGLHLYENGKDRRCTGAPSKGNGNGDGKGNGGTLSSGPSQSDPGNGHSRLTARQLAAIYAIAKSKGMDKDDVQRKSINEFDRMPDFLSKSQASNLIQALQSE